MRNRIYAALVVMLFAAALPARAQEAEWLKFAPTGGGFSILLPAPTREETEAKRDFTSHLFTTRNDRALYLVGYGDYAPNMTLNPDGELMAVRDNFLRALQAHLVDSRSVTLAGHPGLEFTGENDRTSFKSRIYLVGNRVYQCAAVVLPSKDDAANVDRFFSSFAFTADR